MAEENQPRMPDVARELRALLARLPAALDPEAAGGVQGLIQFNLTGEGGGAYFLALRDGTCTVSEGRHPAPTVILTLSAADCVGVISGTVKARVLFEAGRLQVAGNVFLALMLRDLFPRERLLP